MAEFLQPGAVDQFQNMNSSPFLVLLLVNVLRMNNIRSFLYQVIFLMNSRKSVIIALGSYVDLMFLVIFRIGGSRHTQGKYVFPFVFL